MTAKKKKKEKSTWRQLQEAAASLGQREGEERILSQVLTPEARISLSDLQRVNSDKGNKVASTLTQYAKTGQLTGKLGVKELHSFVARMDEAARASPQSPAEDYFSADGDDQPAHDQADHGGAEAGGGLPAPSAPDKGDSEEDLDSDKEPILETGARRKTTGAKKSLYPTISPSPPPRSSSRFITEEKEARLRTEILQANEDIQNLDQDLLNNQDLKMALDNEASVRADTRDVLVERQVLLNDKKVRQERVRHLSGELDQLLHPPEHGGGDSDLLPGHQAVDSARQEDLEEKTDKVLQLLTKQLSIMSLLQTENKVCMSRLSDLEQCLDHGTGKKTHKERLKRESGRDSSRAAGRGPSKQPGSKKRVNVRASDSRLGARATAGQPGSDPSSTSSSESGQHLTQIMTAGECAAGDRLPARARPGATQATTHEEKVGAAHRHVRGTARVETGIAEDVMEAVGVTADAARVKA